MFIGNQIYKQPYKQRRKTNRQVGKHAEEKDKQKRTLYKWSKILWESESPCLCITPNHCAFTRSWLAVHTWHACLHTWHACICFKTQIINLNLVTPPWERLLTVERGREGRKIKRKEIGKRKRRGRRWKRRTGWRGKRVRGGGRKGGGGRGTGVRGEGKRRGIDRDREGRGPLNS